MLKTGLDEVELYQFFFHIELSRSSDAVVGYTTVKGGYLGDDIGTR